MPKIPHKTTRPQPDIPEGFIEGIDNNGWMTFDLSSTKEEVIQRFVRAHGKEPERVFYSKFGNLIMAGPIPDKSTIELEKAVKVLHSVSDKLNGVQEKPVDAGANKARKYSQTNFIKNIDS